MTDGGTSDTFKIVSNIGSLKISGFGSDATGVVDLLNGVGGYTTAGAAYAALTSDGAGGSLLSLGTNGSIHLLGVAPGAPNAANSDWLSRPAGIRAPAKNSEIKFGEIGTRYQIPICSKILQLIWRPRNRRNLKILQLIWRPRNRNP